MISPEWNELFQQSQQSVHNIIETVHRDPVVYPPPEHIFKAFENCLPEQVKVVGQDCYHKEGQATGMAFAVPPDCKVPPSLRNIQKELKADVGVDLSDRTLQKWSDQGVLLLNSALTVRKGEPRSHLGQLSILSENKRYYLSSRHPFISPVSLVGTCKECRVAGFGCTISSRSF